MNKPTKVCILDSTGDTKHTLHFESNGSQSTMLCYDDNIQDIKYKILDGLHTSEDLVDYNKISYEELYLFTVIERKFDAFYWFKQISRNHTLNITKPVLKQYFKKT